MELIVRECKAAGAFTPLCTSKGGMGAKQNSTPEALAARVKELEAKLQGPQDELELTITTHEVALDKQRLKLQWAMDRIEYLRQYAFGKKSERRRRKGLGGDGELIGSLFHAELIAEAERTAKQKRVQGELSLSGLRNP